ncbi:MAG: replication-associated recombination protein A [Oscillospiraceae bacterium]|jgi:putative ATPase|nr:replication-associated recombination protein A [Oscillospiraceae bacterium]
MNRPLADELRPRTLDEVVGQAHILGQRGLLRRLIESGSVPNLIFYGPSGTGKTTVANIVADRTARTFRKINATSGSTADIRDVIAERGTLMAQNGTLLYIDEIQYFSKKQQQTLLEYIEDGSIRLVASTTENPFFYVYGAILSRSTVFEFKPVAREDALPAIVRAVAILERRNGLTCKAESGVWEHVAQSCGGDVRKALNAVEVLFGTGRVIDGTIAITLEDAVTAGQRSAMRYDRGGDEHYDILSALQKSIRGSDPDAALHYLARLLEAGDMLSACRRLLVIASEDVGLAYPQAAVIVKACCDNARELGLPEAQLPLSQAVLLLATAPKSNSTLAINKARADIASGKAYGFPRALQNVHADGADASPGTGDTIGHFNAKYLYPHDFPNHWTPQQYLPDSIKGAKYYEYGDNKTEQSAKAYWDAVMAQHNTNL